MGWADIVAILEGELANFADPPERLKALRDWNKYSSREAAIDALKFDESTHWKIVNKACVQFAETRTWPQLNQEQLFWIYARLHTARVLAQIALNSKRTKGFVFPDPDKDVPERSVLEDLLVRYWLFQGRSAFLGSIIFDPMGPYDPLAGIPPPEF